MDLFASKTLVCLPEGEGYIYSNNKSAEGSIELISHIGKKDGSKQRELNNKIFKSVSRIVKGDFSDDYIHLDIVSPFGEELDPYSVEQKLKEKLGPKREEYGDVFWSEYFNDNTSQGTVHRILVTLSKKENLESLPYDYSLPPEVSALALAQQVHRETSRSDFQFVISGFGNFFSVLYLKNTPFHVLRLKKMPREEMLDRLKKQAHWGAKDKEIPVLYCQPSLASLFDSKAQVVLAKLPQEDRVPPLVNGYALIQQSPELLLHDHGVTKNKAEAQRVREQFGFFRSVAISAALSLALILSLWIYNRNVSNELMALKEKAEMHREVLLEIENLQKDKTSIAESIQHLSFVWNAPVPWHVVLNGLQNALPEKSGWRGLLVEKTDRGTYQIHLRTWIQDWDNVSVFKKNIEDLKFFSKIEFSEQKKNLSTNSVNFQVLCELKE